MNLVKERIVTVLAPALILAFGLVMTGCGGGDAGDKARSHVKKLFTSGDIFEYMGKTERVAFANRGKFSSKEGGKVFEANGVQYRMVRVNFLEKLDKDDLEGGDDTRLEAAGITEKIYDLVKDEKLKAVAAFEFEIVPSASYLKENASEIIMSGRAPSSTAWACILIQDEDNKWKIVRNSEEDEKVYFQAASAMIRVLVPDDTEGMTDAQKTLRKNLKKKQTGRELAKRMISDPPDEDEDEDEDD